MICFNARCSTRPRRENLRIHTAMLNKFTCPNCLYPCSGTFYSVENVPVHSVMLVPTREEAVQFPTGDITLGWCANCGFITNTSFDALKMNYSPKCEETQGFSKTFREFHQSLAERIIRRFELRHKLVLEIGCGKGEFLSLLCSLGENHGIGFDPAFVPERRPMDGAGTVEYIQDFYSETYAHIRPDLIVCKMTLEHIPNTNNFLRMVKSAIDGNSNTAVFIQVPNMERVLRDCAFWDIYHEHCSYFTPKALRNLFAVEGFEVQELWSGYEHQYLMLTGRQMDNSDNSLAAIERCDEHDCRTVTRFAGAAQRQILYWRALLSEMKQNGKHAVIWGSGSKCVAFLSAVGGHASGCVEYVVDVNPFRHGSYVPQTGQEIVSPAFLRGLAPDVVIIMNPIYTAEICGELQSMGLHCSVLSVGSCETHAGV